MKNDDQPIGSAEAAKLLGIKRTTLDQWTSNKLIPFVRISRNLIKFRPVEIQALIEARHVPAIGTNSRKRQPPTRQAGKPEAKVPTEGAHGKAPAKSAREKPKDRALNEERKASLKKAMEYRAREYFKEKERRLRRARRKAAEDAIGKPDVYE